MSAVLARRGTAGAVVALLALGLGYLASLDPTWLHLGLDLTSPRQLTLLALAAAAALALLRWPTAGCLALLAVVYTNASEVGVRVHQAPSVLQAMAPMLAVAVLGRAARRSRWLVADALFGWLVAYAALLAASAIWADDPALADARLIEHLKSLCLVFVIANLVRSRATLRQAVWVLVLAAALLAGLSVYQVATESYGSTFGGFARIKQAHIVGSVFEPRIAGPLSDPNFYAQALLMVVPLALYRFWDEPARRGRVLAGGSLALVLMALVFTYSRGAALAAGLVLLLAMAHKKRLRYVAWGLVLIVPLVALAPAEFGGRLGTLRQLVPDERELVLHADSSIEKRRLYMGTAWLMFREHPLLGVGAGNFPARYDEYADRIGSTVSSYEEFGETKFPHSLYLEVAAETGLIGLAIFGVIIWLTLRRFWAAYRALIAARDARSAGLVISLALSFLGYLTTSLILHGDYIRYFWLLVALAIACKNGDASIFRRT